MRIRVAPVLLAFALAGCGGSDGKPEGAKAKATATPAQLPGGGRVIFHAPKRRVVAFYGSPDDEQLGVLGIGPPDAMARRLLKVAKRYERPQRPVLPAMELIATIVTSDPGPDGLYRRRARNAVIRRYLRAARSIGAILILDVQPGRAEFLPEVKRYERWLREPDVSLALDPEWRMGPNEIPGQVIGSVDASEVVEVGAWLDQLTERHDLPQKLMLVHQFTEDMIEGREALRPYPNVAVVLNVDGFGGQEIKRQKYRAFTRIAGFAFNGFKLFYEEDLDLMSPRQVLRLRPPPDVVMYE